MHALENTVLDQTQSETIVVVDDDKNFLETIRLNLEDEGFQARAFARGTDVLDWFAGGGAATAMLLDWRMPGIDGLEVLRRMRQDGIDVPVIFLTSLSDQIYEEAALDRGAVDFVEKSRSFSIILKRIELIRRDEKRAPDTVASGNRRPNVSRFGVLELDHDSQRAAWAGARVNLTLSEFRVVELLATRRDADVSYREIYDAVRGEGFWAGHGEEGYRSNVRSMVRRIRGKLRAIDPDFDCIQTYPGFGYRWANEKDPSQ